MKMQVSPGTTPRRSRLLCALLSLLPLAGLRAATDTLAPLADSYVVSTSAGQNFGTTLLLHSINGATSGRRTYIRFSLSGVTGTSATVTSATLKLYAAELPNGTAPVKAYLVTNDTWGELNLTWSNMPAPGTLQDSKSVAAVGWVNFDVTPAVKSQIDGDKLVSLVLYDSTNASKAVRFMSRENTQKPVLEVVTSTTTAPYAPFLASSRWRKKLGSAPVHTLNTTYLANMTSANATSGGSVTAGGANVPYPTLNGVDAANLYSQGLGFADSTSPRYKILYYDDDGTSANHAVFHHADHVAITTGTDGKGGVRFPTALRALYDMTDPNSIPRRGSNDAGSNVIDRELDVNVHGPYVVHFAETKYYPKNSVLPTTGWWEDSANSGRTVTETNGVIVANATSFYAADSLGIASETSPPSAGATGFDQRNSGHRGIPGTMMFATGAEVASGDVGHALSITLSNTGYNPVQHYWPMSSQENGRSGVIPEGTFMRIKASLTDADIASRVSWISTAAGRAEAATLARALRDYGCFVGDNGGSSSRIRLQAGVTWSLPGDALKNFVFRSSASTSDWQFVQGGYDP